MNNPAEESPLDGRPCADADPLGLLVYFPAHSTATSCKRTRYNVVAMSTVHFPAPWCRSLKVRTGVIAVLLTSAVVAGMLVDLGTEFRWVLIAVPPVLAAILAAFGVRGYALSADRISIKRWGRTTSLPLAGLLIAEGKADAFGRAFRVDCNLGAFGFVGFGWSKELKLFRTYATDPARAVVLQYAHRRFVITPHDPQQFIVRTRTLLKTANADYLLRTT